MRRYIVVELENAQTMKKLFGAFFALLLTSTLGLGQGVSCPAVVARPDTTINCNGCVQLDADPVSGFNTTAYTLQQIPYNPYSFNGGTPILVNIDDVWSSTLPVGFPFCFYGSSYTQCVVGSNGVVSFDLSYANNYCAWPIAQGIPGNTDVLNSILGPFHDIDPSVGGSIRWAQYGVAPCRVFVVSFSNIPMFSCNSQIATQQIALYETTNIIEIYIQNKPTCASWNAGAAIEGIQNATGTQAVVVPGRNFPGTWTVSNDAYRFVPSGAQNYTVQWFEVGNPVAIASTDTVTVCPTTSTDYYAEVIYTNCNGNTVTVRDTASITLSGSGALVLTPSQTNVTCNGGNNGTASVAVGGNTLPVTYQWSNGGSNPNIANLTAGVYTVTVTEQGSPCPASVSVTITEPTAITVSTSHVDANCNGAANGSATAVAAGGSGPYTYAWSNGASGGTINNLAAGNYTVTVTDFNFCTQTASVTVGQPAALSNTFSFSPILCNGGTGGITANPAGGSGSYTYAWSNGGNTATITGVPGGNYSVTITDANAAGCQLVVSTTLVNPSALTATISNTPSICGSNNGTATASPSGGTTPYSFAWSNGQTTATAINLSAGNYSVTVSDANGCTVSLSTTVIEPPLIQLSISGSDVVCFGNNDGTAQVAATGGALPLTFAWSNGGNSPNISNLGPGNYTVTVTDINGCFSTASILVNEPPLVTVAATAEDVLCHGEVTGSVHATAAGGIPPLDLLWSTGHQLANIGPLAAGTYSVTVTDQNGCTASASTTINEPTALSLALTGENSVCDYDSVRLFSTMAGGVGPYIYDWTSSPTSVPHISTPNLVYPGTEDLNYFLTVTDANGCRIQEQFYVESNPTPDVAFVPHRDEACDSMTVYFTNLSTPGASYFWEFGDGTTSNLANPEHFYTNGIWSVELTVTTNEGCVNHYLAQDLIEIIPTPYASYISNPIVHGHDPFYLSEATVNFQVDVPFYASGLWWSFGNGDSASTWNTTYTWPEPGEYLITLEVYNRFGCHSDTSEVITILPDPILWVPNAFTPGTGDLNDRFDIVGVNIVEFHIEIFDRWGKLLFLSNSLSDSWDGRFGNETVPEGVYVYRIKAVDQKGQKIDKTGSITLLR